MKKNVIRVVNVFLIIIVVLLLLFSVREKLELNGEEKIDKLAFTMDKVRVRQNEKLKLGINISPKSIEEYNLKFSSSNKSIAEVNNEGEVIPIKPGKVKVTVKSEDGKVKDSCEVVVLKEYLFFIGDSNWELIEGKRNGGDTKKPYDVDYGSYKKDKNLFFIAKSGAGLSWFSGSVPKYMKDNGYAKRDELVNSSKDMIDIIKSHDEAYFKVIVGLGTNDIKFVSSKEMCKEYGKYYAEVYNEIAKSLPSDEVYIYSVIPIGKANSCNVYSENDYKKKEHRNTKVMAFNDSVKSNLKGSNIKYIDIYKHFDSLAKNNKICFTKDGHWNKKLTQQVYDEIIKTVN